MSTLARLAEFLVAAAAIVLAWHAYVSVFDVPAFMLPAPRAVGDAIVALAVSGQLWRSLSYTLGNVAAGFAIGAAAGTAVGLLLARRPRLDAALSGPILFLQTAPKIALAPLFVIWFGLGATSKILLIVSLELGRLDRRAHALVDLVPGQPPGFARRLRALRRAGTQRS